MDQLFKIREEYPKDIIGGIEIETCVNAQLIRNTKKFVYPKGGAYEDRLGNDEHQTYWRNWGYKWVMEDRDDDGVRVGERFEGGEREETVEVYKINNILEYGVEEPYVKYKPYTEGKDGTITYSDERFAYLLEYFLEDYTYIETNPEYERGEWMPDNGSLIGMDIPPYRATEDTSIVCDDDDYTAVEYVTIKPYPIVDIMDDRTTIGKVTREIIRLAHKCGRDENGTISCGTHVHMSYNGITKLDYPNFNVAMRYLWIAYYQPYCLAHFYQFQNRHKNVQYSKISTAEPVGKYEMFNEKPSENSSFWHFEFRGYGEMSCKWKNGVPQTYMKILMNLWLAAIDLYKRNNIANVKNVRIESKQLKYDPPVRRSARLLGRQGQKFLNLKF